MIPVTKPFLPPKEEYEKYLDGIWTRNWLTNMGPLASQLEMELKEYLNVKHLLYLTNGTWSLFNINCMAIGGMGAVVYFDNHKKILNVLFDKYFFLFITIYTIACLVMGIKFGFFHYEVYSFLFIVIILNLACNDVYKKTLENKFTNYLGSISYGLYMYHPMIIPIAIIAGKKFNSNIIIYLISIFCTVILAASSYEYFEKYFLKFKNRIK